jgi:hypothetical protein
VENPIPVMFYHECLAYKDLAEISVLQKLKRQDYKIYINDKGNVPEAYKKTGTFIHFNFNKVLDSKLSGDFHIPRGLQINLIDSPAGQLSAI